VVLFLKRCSTTEQEIFAFDLKLRKQKILFAPLDWGLGHATRSIPIIQEFLNQGCDVQIAASGNALVLLKKEYSALKFYPLVSYQASYSIHIPFMIKILIQIPKFLLAIREEHRMIEQIIKAENIDFVISDNRYGCWSKGIPSVLITHQTNILMSPSWKWLEGFINWGNQWQIRKFKVCWIPDFPNGIGGRMTKSDGLKVKYIGMVSRFEKLNLKKRFDILALISGPEPQRTVIETKIRGQLEKSMLNYFIVRGKLDGDDHVRSEKEANHLTSEALNEVIASSELIISRSGYTTIMDLCKLGKKAIFIPTPGQTEQEYLAKELKRLGITFYQEQNEFDLTTALEESKKYKGFEGYPDSPNLLAEAIDTILNHAI